MGHIRLGELPKTQQWSGVFHALKSSDLSTDIVAAAVASSSRLQLEALKGHDGLSYCFWVLGRLVTSARGESFAAELKRLGVRGTDFSSGIDFVRAVSEAVSTRLGRRGNCDLFTRMAELSLREVLSTNLVEQSRSLFGTGKEEIQSACRVMSSKRQFGRVAKEFFGAFLCRAIQFVTDKELSNHVGPGQPLSSPAQASRFSDDIERYCRESAEIIGDFAGGWLSKKNWETGKNISANDARRFCAYALEKLQMELSEGST